MWTKVALLLAKHQVYLFYCLIHFKHKYKLKIAMGKSKPSKAGVVPLPFHHCTIILIQNVSYVIQKVPTSGVGHTALKYNLSFAQP